MAANRTHTKARASHATASGGCPGSAWPTSHSRNEIYVVVAERLRTSAFGRKRTFSRHQTVDRVIRAFEVLWPSPHKAALKHRRSQSYRDPLGCRQCESLSSTES